MKNKIALSLAALALFCALLWAVRPVLTGLLDGTQALALAQTVRDRWWAPLAFIFIYAGMSALALPATVPTLVGGAAWGPVWGTLYNAIASNLGASAAFFVARNLGRPWVQRFSSQLPRFEEGIEENGFSVILTLRLIPILPHNGINFGAGLSSVKYRDYLLGSLIGMLPGTIVYTYFADSLIKGAMHGREAFGRVALAGVLLAGLSLLPKVIRRFRRVRVPGDNRLKQLTGLGQSIWLDYISRSLLTTGDLVRMIEEDGLRGMTSNPAIFEKAIAGSADYEEMLTSLRGRNLTPQQIYEKLAVRDIQDAADALKPVYERTRRRDGYVSLEVSPFLARDTQRTIEEAHRLWRDVDRPNLMIKVPGTREGISAIGQLISDGINVNVTLLFSQEIYQKAAWAAIVGLEQRASRKQDISGIASVASFFVSRIDASLDPRLPQSLKGKVAIANAKLAYARYKDIIRSDRWKALAAKGAMPQRLLWASTSTKNPAYRDVLYVEELIGPDTVNTVPPATLEAFRDHGRPRLSLEENLQDARKTLEALGQEGISMEEVTDGLLKEAVRLFEEPFKKLVEAVAQKTAV